MKRKLLSIIIVTSMAMTMVACGGNDSEKSKNADKEKITSLDDENIGEDSTEETTDAYEAQGLEIFEKEFDSEYNEDMYKVACEIQGNVKDFDVDSYVPVVIANNTIYRFDTFTFADSIAVDEKVNRIDVFNSLVIGNTVLAVSEDDVAYCYNESNEEPYFVNVKFTNNDYLVSVDMDDFSIINIDEGSCTYRYFNEESAEDINDSVESYNDRYPGKVTTLEKNDENTYIVVESPINMDKYKLNDGSIIEESIKKIVSVPSDLQSGSQIWCITENNQLFRVEDASIEDECLYMTTDEPLATEVENVYSSSGITTKITAPIYSKIGDEKYVYSKVYGESMAVSDDDLEISIEMPENHNVNEIKNIYALPNSVIFEFDNGDLYYTDTIYSNAEKIYTMSMIDVLSQLNSEGKIKKIAGCTIVYDRLYVLMDNNKIYSFDI